MPEGSGNILASKPINAQLDAEIAERVQFLKEEHGPVPHLDIIADYPDPNGPVGRYINIKNQVGVGLGFSVQVSNFPHIKGVTEIIEKINADERRQGVIVQLPMRLTGDIDAVLDSINPAKDVDGLGSEAFFAPATARAVMRLMDGYGIDVLSNRVAVLGHGRLVGAPLVGMLEEMDHQSVSAFDEHSDPYDIMQGLDEADIIVSAMGVPGAVKPELFKNVQKPRVLIDAGAAEQDGQIHGDVSKDMRAAAEEHDWKITPELGGLGPLTVRMLFTNTLDAYQHQLQTV